MPPSITLSRGVTSRELKLKAAAAAFFDRESPSPRFTYVDKRKEWRKVFGRSIMQEFVSMNPASQAVLKKHPAASISEFAFYSSSRQSSYLAQDPRHRIGITSIRPSIKLLFILLFLFFASAIFMGNLRLLLSTPFELYGWRGNRNLHGNKGTFLKEQKEGKEWHGTGRFVVGNKRKCTGLSYPTKSLF